jgi:hypothetical protein
MHWIVDPSALAQTAIYMAGVLTGYALLTPTEELQRVWQVVRSAWTRKE